MYLIGCGISVDFMRYLGPKHKLFIRQQTKKQYYDIGREIVESVEAYFENTGMMILTHSWKIGRRQGTGIMEGNTLESTYTYLVPIYVESFKKSTVTILEPLNFLYNLKNVHEIDRSHKVGNKSLSMLNIVIYARLFHIIRY